MGKNIKKLGISSLIVICLGMGLYWYSSIEAHPRSVVSSESDTKEVVNDNIKANGELEVANNDDNKIIDNEDKDVQKPSEGVELNDENSTVSKTEDSALKQENNSNNNKELTIEEAKNLLKQYNPNVDYIYQGDETMFKEVLQDKGYKGYLFLPNVDGDIGFFVDKYSSDIYKFHPSGYMEKI